MNRPDLRLQSLLSKVMSQAVRERPCVVFGGRMDEKGGSLVHDDDIAILVEDGDRHLDCWKCGFLGGGYPDRDLVAATGFAGEEGRLPIHHDPAGAGQSLDHPPGDLHRAGEHFLDRLPGFLFGDLVMDPATGGTSQR